MEIKSFEIFYSDQVFKKDIPRLDMKTRKILEKAIYKKLSHHPDIFGKPLRGNLKPAWVLRVGSYRVIYDIKPKKVEILAIGHRSNIYDD